MGKTLAICFVEKTNLAQEIWEALKFQKDDLEVEEYMQKIEKTTKNILTHELNEVDILYIILQSSLKFEEMKKKILFYRKKQLKLIPVVLKQMALKKEVCLDFERISG